MSEEIKVQDLSDHTYRTEIPNIVYDMGLSANSFRVYAELKRIAGDNGCCFKTNDNICQSCGISEPTLIKIKKELQEPFPQLNNKPLITINKRLKEDGSWDSDLIEIVNIWPENMREYLKKYEEKNEEKSGGGCLNGLSRVLKSFKQGTKTILVKEEQSKKNPVKKGQCQDDALFHKGEKHEARYEKQKSNDPERFIKALNPDQKNLHDELIEFSPTWGDKLKSQDICAWFLSRKYSVGQVQIAFEVYKQDASEALNKGRSIQNMGGAMVSIIKSGRRLRSPDIDFNRDHANMLSKKYNWMTVLDRYVKIRANELADEVELDQNKSTFITRMDEMIRKAERYA